MNIFGHDIALDSVGQAHVAGVVGGGLWTTAVAYQESHQGNNDGFLAIVSTDGVTLTYATYLGGNDAECNGSPSGCTLALDDGGNVYLAGDTESPNFPTKNAYDATCGTDGNCDPVGGYRDAFLVKLDPEGNGASDLLYATFVGHSGEDAAAGVAVDGAGNAYLAGYTASHDFPTTSGAYMDISTPLEPPTPSTFPQQPMAMTHPGAAPAMPLWSS
ncbi:MAG: SBBP repeat-containing protein [Anaerolineae bacterium]|nr:SBBP repeat-containing protein [Anaerolineae bacterium]